MANFGDLSSDVVTLIVQRIPTTAAALAFCAASKQLHDAHEADVWARESQDATGTLCSVGDVVRVKALERGQLYLYRRLMTQTGMIPDMRDLGVATWHDSHAFVDEILSHHGFNTNSVDLPDSHQFKFAHRARAYQGVFNCSPLVNACWLGNVAMVRKLLSVPGIGASVNRIWKQDYHRHANRQRMWSPSRFGSAVHAAASSANPDALRVILDAGGDPDSGLEAPRGWCGYSEWSRPAILAAFDFERAENAETLCLAGADITCLRGHRSQCIQRIASRSESKPWDEFIPFLAHHATKVVPVTWLLGVAVESQAYTLTRALLKVYPHLTDTANALMLAYKRFTFTEWEHRSLVYRKDSNPQRNIEYGPEIRFLMPFFSSIPFDKRTR